MRTMCVTHCIVRPRFLCLCCGFNALPSTARLTPENTKIRTQRAPWQPCHTKWVLCGTQKQQLQQRWHFELVPKGCEVRAERHSVHTESEAYQLGLNWPCFCQMQRRVDKVCLPFDVGGVSWSICKTFGPLGGSDGGRDSEVEKYKKHANIKCIRIRLSTLLMPSGVNACTM